MINKFFLILFSLTSFVEAEPIPMHVKRVVDGDTIIVENKGLEEKVRLLSIDAPEMDQAYGKSSKEALEGYVLDKEVQLEIDESNRKDKYGRTLAIIMIDNLNINKTMIEEGHAWADRYYSPHQEFIEAEEQARLATKGLWAEPKAPWVFRGENKVSFSNKASRNNSYTCDARKTCKQMRSCEEAQYHIKVCSNQSLDRDKDGISCEKLCRKPKS